MDPQSQESLYTTNDLIITLIHTVSRQREQKQLPAKKVEIKMQAVIDAHHQQLRDLERQRDMKVIEAKLKVYLIETPHEASKCNSVRHKAKGIKFSLLQAQKAKKN